MPRVAVDSKHFFTFVRGLITEATGVTYPENSMVDGDNVDIGVSGICRRRKGLNFEEGYSYSTPTLTSDEVTYNAITVHEWLTVNGRGSLNFWVIQIGTKLYVGDMGGASLSDGYKGTIDLTELYATYVNSRGEDKTENFVINTEQAKYFPFDSSYGKGSLFFTSKYVNPFYLAYNPDGETLTVNMIHMEERDFEGVDDGLAIEVEPKTLSDAHRYNLENQGWTGKVAVDGAGSGGGGTYDDSGDYTMDLE